MTGTGPQVGPHPLSPHAPLVDAPPGLRRSSSVLAPGPVWGLDPRTSRGPTEPPPLASAPDATLLGEGGCLRRARRVPGPVRPALSSLGRPPSRATQTTGSASLGRPNPDGRGTQLGSRLYFRGQVGQDPRGPLGGVGAGHRAHPGQSVCGVTGDVPGETGVSWAPVCGDPAGTTEIRGLAPWGPCGTTLCGTPGDPPQKARGQDQTPQGHPQVPPQTSGRPGRGRHPCLGTAPARQGGGPPSSQARCRLASPDPHKILLTGRLWAALDGPRDPKVADLPLTQMGQEDYRSGDAPCTAHGRHGQHPTLSPWARRQ